MWQGKVGKELVMYVLSFSNRNWENTKLVAKINITVYVYIFWDFPHLCPTPLL
jgi:hypothetical protein